MAKTILQTKNKISPTSVKFGKYSWRDLIKNRGCNRADQNQKDVSREITNMRIANIRAKF